MQITYTNWRGQMADREIKPIALVFMDVPGNVNQALASYPPGWFLEAFAKDRGEIRHFFLGSDPERRFNPHQNTRIEIGDLKDIEAAVKGLEEKATDTHPEIERLASYMMENYPTFPFEGSAVDFAIQVLEACSDMFDMTKLVKRVTTAPVPVGKQSSPELSTTAARILNMTASDMVSHMSYPDTGVKFIKDIRSLAASVLSQDETKGQG